MRMKDKALGIIIISAILVAAVIGGGFYYLELQKTRFLLQTGLEAERKAKELRDANPPSVSAEWKTYRNKKYGFEMRYPPEFTSRGEIYNNAFSEDWPLSRDHLQAVFETMDNVLGVEVNPSPKGLEDANVYAEKIIRFRGRDTKLQLTSDGSNLYAVFFDNPGGSTTYFFYLSCKSRMCDMQKMIAIFEQILSTFTSINVG